MSTEAPADTAASGHPTRDDLDEITDQAIEMVRDWLVRGDAAQRRAERTLSTRLRRLVEDPDSVAFTMQFVDRVARHRDHRLAAQQLHALVTSQPLPAFLGPLDRVMLRVGARVAPVLAPVVMPIAHWRMRRLVGHLVVDAEPDALRTHLVAMRDERFALNVNLLGEAVLGEAEARRRMDRTLAIIDRDDVDYVSVKVTSIASQIDHWAFDSSLARVKERLRELYHRSALSDPPTFVNLDMEEYRDLELTIAAFTELLDEPDLRGLDAGIVLQTYLPESYPSLQHLVAWADARRRAGGGSIKIRLVKGANLAMERVEAAMHGWQPAPYGSKADVDANFKRCLDWVLTPEHTEAVRIGVASHNLFDVAWARLLGERRGVIDRIEFEMLQGMSPGQSRTIRDDASGLLLYTPVVGRDDFDVAISYLVRRLEENTSEENFLRHLFDLTADSAEFEAQAQRFRRAVARRNEVSAETRRVAEEPTIDRGFCNHPETDPAQPQTVAWLEAVRSLEPAAARTEATTDPAAIDAAIERARLAGPRWVARGADERREILWRVAAELDSRRDELMATMVSEGRKTVAESDPEICEAIDFARWYGDQAIELDRLSDVTHEPLGVVAVVPPWNFPVAIPGGGVFAALAAGNTVLLKPAPETPRCAEIVAECCWTAGVPTDVLQFLRTADDEAGQRLVATADAVILTGAWETAALFGRWRDDNRVFAETSGKNALVITPHADIDLAVADLVTSAFGHSGQKCSAASLAILVGDLHDDPRFLRQLIDAVTSLRCGWPDDPATTFGPTITAPEGKLARALGELDPGESWLLEPRPLEDGFWSPGVKTGVRRGSWFHRTECFGPVLGLMHAEDLDEAIEIQNDSEYGLTGGIHSLDDDEIDRWLDRVEVGNAYVNRAITGAIVNRQPFGGWKRSAVGPGAKAGGPDYLLQLVKWRDAGPEGEVAWADAAAASDARWWDRHYRVARDPSALFCEANQQRYRPHPTTVIRATDDAPVELVRRAAQAASLANPDVVVSSARPLRAAVVEDDATFQERLADLRWGRVRLIGSEPPELKAAARAAEVTIIDEPVTANGRLELRWYLREQSVSRTLHRFGNLVATRHEPIIGDRS